MTPAPALPSLTARAVHRAIGEARRGVAVVLDADGGVAFAALPAETATAETLAEFLAAIDGTPTLLLARSRALAGDIAVVPVPGAIDVVAVPVGTIPLSVEFLRSLADPTWQAGTQVSRAGNALPVPANMAEAAVTMAKLAGLLPAMLVGPAGPPADMLRVAATDLLSYQARAAQSLQRSAEARVPLDGAEESRILSFRPPDGGAEHLAILIGRPELVENPLVRVHSACFTGDFLGSRRCDCGPQLHQAIRRMDAEGAGVLLYMAQEGRGIGLVNKLRAYTLQDTGLDTLDANRALGFGADERNFAAAAAMLRALGMTQIRLLTNNPAKISGLTAYGIEVVGRVSHAIAANGENDAYLQTKASRFGHLLG